MTVPEFDERGSRYDLSTFAGRYRHFLEIVNPRTLLATDKQLQDAVLLLHHHRAGRVTGATNEDLWNAKHLKDSILHPDTNEKIPRPFRMSGFVPFGVPIIVGMLVPTSSSAVNIFWQVLNQTHNALVNYFNRNASTPTPDSYLVGGYLGAVTGAITVITTLRKLVDRLPPARAAAVRPFIQFPAVATANVCNVLLMRYNELEQGIRVRSPEGKDMGMSIVAARQAITETAITRIILPAPILLLPPLIMNVIDQTSFLTKFPKLRLPVQTAVCTAAFGFALPLAISIFPQMGSIPAAQLEPEFRNRVDSRGRPIETFEYNKGL